VSTRRVDDVVQAMGLSGISKSQDSKLCKEIDERVHAFLDRPLTGDWPYLWLDAAYLKQRDGGRGDCRSGPSETRRLPILCQRGRRPGAYVGMDRC
jgi:transposase-like protein